MHNEGTCHLDELEMGLESEGAYESRLLKTIPHHRCGVSYSSRQEVAFCLANAVLGQR